jgi:hypothetical protein
MMVFVVSGVTTIGLQLSKLKWSIYSWLARRVDENQNTSFRQRCYSIDQAFNVLICAWISHVMSLSLWDCVADSVFSDCRTSV